MCQIVRNLYKIILTAQRQQDAKKERVFKALLKQHQDNCPECKKRG